MTPPVSRRLPISIVVRRSFLFAWERRAFLAIPFLLLTMVSVTADVVASQVFASHPRLSMLAGAVLEQVFAISFAVGMNRYVLLGEMRAGAGLFFWERHFVQYLLTSIVLALLGILVFWPVMGVSRGDAGPPGSGAAGLLALVALVSLFVGAVVLARLSVSLPAAAIGDGRPMREIWKATHGNGLRLIATSMLTVVPFFTAAILVENLSHALVGAGAVAEMAILFLQGFIWSAQVIVVTTMMALNYDVLVRGGGPVAAGV